MPAQPATNPAVGPGALKVLALIPAFNEAARIESVAREALRHLPLLVVDDGSRDETAAFARVAGAQLLQQFPNQGKGRALQAGFRYALQQGYAAVITLDADGQHDPAEIPSFLNAFSTSGLDLIIGARDFRQIPPVRRLANTLGRLTFSWALGQPVRDNQSGYRMISRRLMQAMLESAEPGFEFEVEMIVVCVQRGFGLGWVPIRTIYAGEKSHIRPLAHTLQFIRMLQQTRRRVRLFRLPPSG